ncbi:uncharacterized protein LOC143231054 [Tachypleus tridentatus]|uniref:uncharacterized protein LOC143231054 n=1 Tax=Tachypleus tridentatus TaxID=6853 RepID=UPI003FD5F202
MFSSQTFRYISKLFNSCTVIITVTNLCWKTYGYGNITSFLYTRVGNVTGAQRFHCAIQCNRILLCAGFEFDISDNCVLFHLGESPSESSYYVKMMALWRREATANIAEGKLSAMSSLFGSKFPASKSVDGIADCGNQISHTANEQFPWWSVDLGDVYVVRKVTIWNRQSVTNYYRLHDFEIRVGNTPVSEVGKPITANQLCAFHDGGGITDKPVTFICDQPYGFGGRYLTVQIIRYCSDCKDPTRNFLHTCEVQVFGYTL